MKQVVQEPAPRVPLSLGFSANFHDFTALWYIYSYFSDIIFSLTKNYNDRPKYADLLAHPFLRNANADTDFNMGTFVTEILELNDKERTAVLAGITLTGMSAAVPE